MRRILVIGLLLSVLVPSAACRPSARFQAPETVGLAYVGVLPGDDPCPNAGAVTADANFIYRGCDAGKIFVNERDPASGFALVDEIAATGFPITSIGLLGTQIHFTDANGDLCILDVSDLHAAPSCITGIDYGLASSVAKSDGIYVSGAQSQIAVNGSKVFHSAISTGERAYRVDVATGSVFPFPAAVSTFLTSQFDRVSGLFERFVMNPTGTSQVRIFAWNDLVVWTTPGCCGPDIHVRVLSTDAVHTVAGSDHTNVVSRAGPFLIGGSEGSEVALYRLPAGGNLTEWQHQVLLRAETGFMGPEDLEVRSLWVDKHDDFVFACTSGGGPASAPDLPTCVVLELREGIVTPGGPVG